ncbi:hypothetical protein GQ55_3G288300 [Panicum hallii var. hallii]|uniref:Uncharacterized protein n=1 Tax=Panicum hallii var. hallii TaxID=1504633 RepID=A0A2T7EEF5_9POAL|nr:hypothetical protein GQ55_3G288300 [Panicum hallii var. hallii]
MSEDSTLAQPTAQRLAKEAWHHPRNSTCSFSCVHIGHTSESPVRLALQSVQWGNFSLIDVTCI